MRVLFVRRRDIRVAEEGDREATLSVSGERIRAPRHVVRKLLELESPYVKLIVSPDGRLISANSQWYSIVNNAEVASWIEERVPVSWERILAKVDDMMLHVRYKLPVKPSGDSEAVFVIFNMNDGKTALKAFYGYMVEGGCILPYVVVRFQKVLARESSVLYALLAAARSWRRWVERLSKLRMNSSEAVERDEAYRIVEELHSRGCILRRHADQAKSSISSLAVPTLWDVAVAVARAVGRDEKFAESDRKLIRAETCVGKILRARVELRATSTT